MKELKLVIGADAKEVTEELTKVVNVLKNFGTNINKSFDNSAKSLNNFKATTDSVAKSLSGIPTGFNTSGITQGANTAIQALEKIKETGSTVAGSIDGIAGAFAELGVWGPSLQKINTSLAGSSSEAVDAGKNFQQLSNNIVSAIAQISSSGKGITQVTAAINQMAAAAIDAGEGMISIGVAKPIQDINTLRNNVLELKRDLAAGFKPVVNIVDPKIPALLNSISASLTNISPAVNAATASLRQAGASTQLFSDHALQSGKNFQDFSLKVTAAISQIGSSTSGILQVTAAINEAAAAARNAGEGFLAIGVQKPIQDITVLRNNVEELKNDLAAGFKPIVNLVDPKTPALLNSVSAALTNISPAVNAANTSLQAASNSARVFSVSVNASLADAISGFNSFKSEAATLAGTFTNIPVVLRPDTKAGLDELRQTVSLLKKDLAGTQLVVPPPIITPPNLDATKRAFGDFDIVINKTLSDSIKSFDRFKVEALGLGSTFSKIPASLKPFNTASIVALRGAVRGLKVDLLDLKFKNVDDQFKSVSKSAITTGQALKSSIKPGADSAGQALQSVGRIAQDLPFGFIGIQNNINPLIESFQRLKLESGSTGKAVKALAGSLLGAGGVGLAISAVSAAVLIYQNGIAGFNKKTKEAKEESDAYAESLKGIVSQISQEASRVSILVTALKGDTLSRKEKVAAIEELKKINPEYFGQLKDETVLVDRLSLAYNGYIASLKKKFETKVIEAQLDKLFNQKFELEIDLDPKAAVAKNKQLSDQILFQQTKLRKQIEDLGGPIDIATITDISKITNEQRKIIALQQRLASMGSVQLFDLANTKPRLDAVNDQIDTLLNKITSLGKVDLDLKTTGKGETQKEDAALKSLKTTLEQYNKQLDIANEKRKRGILPTFEENDVFILETQILDLLRKIDAREVQLKLKPRLEVDPILDLSNFENLERKFRQNLAIDFDEIVLPVDITPLVNENSYYRKLSEAFSSVENNTKRIISSLTGFIIPIDLTLDVDSSNLTKAFDGLTPVIPDTFNSSLIAVMQKSAKDASDAFGTTLKEGLNEQLAGLATQGVVDAFSSFADSIGAALAGVENPIAKFAESFLKIIGDTLQQIGKQIITASTLVETLKKVLTSAGLGAASLPVGLALVALGGFLKNITIPKFADGGIATGATFGIFGEAGTEAIIPLDRLGEFMNDGGGTQRVEVVGSIHNDVIVLSNKRGVASQKRRFGV